MNWNILTSEDQLSEIDHVSENQHVLIYKHSTSCSISTIVKSRLDSDWDLDPSLIQPYFLDLIKYRSVSDFIADKYEVAHESPQVLLIRNKTCTYETSHLDIHSKEIEAALYHKVI